MAPKVYTTFIIERINGRTTAKLFRDIEVGDRVEVTVELKHSYGKMPKATITNLRTGQTRTDTVSRIGDGLAHFDCEGLT